MKKITTPVVAALLLTASLARAQLGNTTGTTTVSVTVTAEAGLTVTTTTTTLTESGANFSPYTGTTSMTYYIRTTASGGSGSIVLEVTSDFSPTAGPSVGTPPSTGDALKYSCTVAAPGNNGTATACTNPTTASTTSQTGVATFGANARSLIGGNSASVSWTLSNDPKYQTGSYSATVTFTISAS
jgi:hypothetical protein